jgi:hypothetical protein
LGSAGPEKLVGWLGWLAACLLGPCLIGDGARPARACIQVSCCVWARLGVVCGGFVGWPVGFGSAMTGAAVAFASRRPNESGSASGFVSYHG